MEENREGAEENYSEVEKIQLIDFSSEDDILVDYPFRDSLEDLRLSVTFKDISEHNSSESLKMANQRKLENAGNSLHQKEEMLSTPEFLEPRRASYLRKSLAWDNAFFSSDGVLDPEELSAMNSGFKGMESSLFPGIPEDLKMRRSVDSDLTVESLESDFTLESDAFSLESFDGDLFEDVRASIHRSCGPLNLKTASCDSVIGKAATSNVPTSKKFHVSTQNKGKFNATSRKQTTNYQKSKTMTESSLPSLNLQHKGECNLMPRILGEQNTISSRQTKRASLGYGNMRNRNTGNGPGLMVPKQSASVDSPSSINFLTPLTKLSSTISLGATKSSSVAGSSCDEFSSNSSSKSILSSVTRNIGSGSSKIGSYGSNSKPPLRCSGRSRSRLSKETSSIHLLSMSHHSNNSPASSIDGWSSESSSSTCSGTAKRRYSNLGDKLRTGTDQASGLHQLTHSIMSGDQHMEGALKEASSIPIESPTNYKPSGLRMPSPKIGFFDEDKPGVRSTMDSMQFRFRSQNASSDPTANTVKKRPSKIQPLRCVPGTRNSIGSPLTPGLHCTSGTKPQRTMHSKQLDNASTKSTVKRNSLGPVVKLRTDTSVEVDNAYCSKTRKVGKGENDRKKIMLTSPIKTEDKRNKGILKNKMGKEGKDQKAGTGILLETVNSVKKDHEAAREHSHCESKENFEDQVHGLSRYFELIDLGGNAIELAGKKSSVCEQNESADGEPFLSVQQQDSPSSTRIPLADKIVACHQTSPQNAKESS